MTLLWTAGGRANRHPWATIWGWTSFSFRDRCSRGRFVSAYQMMKMAMAICDILVAQAAPPTPQRQTATKTMSRTTLTTDDRTMAKKGVRLSPMARSRAE